MSQRYRGPLSLFAVALQQTFAAELQRGYGYVGGLLA